MGAELGLLSLSHLQKLPQSSEPQIPQNHTSSITTTTTPVMWNPKQAAAANDDDDSWEVKAFEEDTSHAMGTTWPPRSYTCTFCRREFRSAQALGGHMNVHRRDRARLHQNSNAPTTTSSSSSATASSTFLIPTQDFVANGGLCFLYSIPNPNRGVFTPTTMNACMDQSPSNLHNLISPPINFPVASPRNDTSLYHSSNITEASPPIDNEELDLELRLGRSS